MANDSTPSEPGPGPGPPPRLPSAPDLEALRRAKREVIAAHGPWTDHNVHLGGGLYTIGPEVRSPRLRRILQIVADAAGRPLAGLRALDLGCLEGMYALELARQGMETVAIEGREANLAKARFARDALGLGNLELRREDVRELSEERHGRFDVTLCLGLLYHLDAPDLFAFVARLAEVTRGFVVLDTYVSTSARERREHGGRAYWGRRVREHDETDSLEARQRRLWNSLDNPFGFWLTRASLLNLLADSGFGSVHECLLPRDPHQPADRLTLLAFRRPPALPLLSPLAGEAPAAAWGERERHRASPEQDPRTRIARGLTHAVPRPLRVALKRLLARLRGRGGDDEGWRPQWRAEPRPPRADDAP